MAPISGATDDDQTATAAAAGQPVPLSELSPEQQAALEAAEQTRINAVAAYAEDREQLTAENERDALDFLLAPQVPIPYKVTVQFDTPQGVMPLDFIIVAQDGAKLERIEDKHRNAVTGMLNQSEANAEIVATGTMSLRTATRTVDINSLEFLRTTVMAKEGPKEITLADPATAITMRFGKQAGLISGVASQIRSISGWDPEKVGVASQVSQAAAGNS